MEAFACMDEGMHTEAMTCLNIVEVSILVGKDGSE